MSAIASLSSAPSALPTVKSHAHGHKKASHVESTDDAISDSMTAPVPAATQQNLFGSLMQSLQQAVGLQTTPATPAAASSATAGASTTAGSTAAAASTAGGGTAIAQSESTAVQKYIGNVSQSLQARSKVSVSA
jgi:hypothetical protein